MRDAGAPGKSLNIDASMKRRNLDIAVLVLTVAACSIPFLSQPFHMDDGFYMDMARNAQQHPLFPNDTPYIFQGISVNDVGSHSHPPFQTYFLAVIHHFFGEGPGTERIYHLFALIFPLMAVLSFYAICTLFVNRPLWPSMLLACSPLFMVMQHNLMTDLPMLALWLASICCFLWAVHMRHKALYVLSAVFQSAAVFTAYQSLALIPLLGFYQLRRGRGRTGWLALAGAPLAIVSWYTINCFHYGRPLWGSTLGYIQSRNPLSMDALTTKLVSILQYQGWLFIFPFFILYVLARDLKWRALALVGLAGVYLAQVIVPGYRPVDKGIFVIGLAAGFFVLLEMGKVAWSAFLKGRETIGLEKSEGQFLGLWYFGFFAYCLFFLTEGSARYILPMLPPFILCFFRVLEISEVLEYRTPARLMNSAMLASGSLVLSLMWGLMLSRADEDFARIYPKAAAEISELAGPLKTYCVGEWGFRYYLGRTGAQPLPADISTVHGGDLIVAAKMAVPHDIPADLRSMLIPVRTFSYKPETSLRILDQQSPAAFYSTGWGLIPFSISQGTLEEIEILQVNLMVERLPWAQVETASGIKPWPGFIALGKEPPLAILAKPGTSLRYPFDFTNSLQLNLQCGVSPDSYVDGADDFFEFSVSQLDRGGRLLAENRLALHPGVRKEDRDWKPMNLRLSRMEEGILEFRYISGNKDRGQIGAFARPVIKPVE